LSRGVVVVIALALAACSNSFAVGEPCTSSSDCVEGLSCIYIDEDETDSRCMMDCAMDETRLCDGGEVCIPVLEEGVTRELGICFLGGPMPVGSPCVDTFDCALGLQCVERGSEQLCFRACTVGDGSACGGGETCEALIGTGDDGYCQPDA